MLVMWVSTLRSDKQPVCDLLAGQAVRGQPRATSSSLRVSGACEPGLAAGAAFGCLSSTAKATPSAVVIARPRWKALRMRSCPARGIRRTLTAHAASELAVAGWRFANYWLPLPAGAAAYLSLRLPCRALIRRRRWGRGAP